MTNLDENIFKVKPPDRYLTLGASPMMSRLRTSPEVDKIFEALSAAQGDYKPVIKNKVNPHFKSKYADISAVRDAVKESFLKHGLVAIQAPEFENGRVVMITRIGHKSGQWVENEVSLKPSGDTPQAVGSAITYGSRYGLCALAGVSAEDEDDDAESAHGRDKQVRHQPMQSPAIFDKGNPKDFEKLEGYLKSVGVEGKNAHWEIATALQGQPFLRDNINQAIKARTLRSEVKGMNNAADSN